MNISNAKAYRIYYKMQQAFDELTDYLLDQCDVTSGADFEDWPALDRARDLLSEGIETMEKVPEFDPNRFKDLMP